MRNSIKLFACFAALFAVVEIVVALLIGRTPTDGAVIVRDLILRIPIGSSDVLLIGQNELLASLALVFVPSTVLALVWALFASRQEP